MDWQRYHEGLVEVVGAWPGPLWAADVPAEAWPEFRMRLELRGADFAAVQTFDLAGWYVLTTVPAAGDTPPFPQPADFGASGLRTRLRHLPEGVRVLLSEGWAARALAAAVAASPVAADRLTEP